MWEHVPPGECADYTVCFWLVNDFQIPASQRAAQDSKATGYPYAAASADHWAVEQLLDFILRNSVSSEMFKVVFIPLEQRHTSL